MSRFDRDVGAAVEALTIRDERSYTWGGCLVRLPRQTTLDGLRLALTQLLYSRFYVFGHPRPLLFGHDSRNDHDDVSLTAALSEANHGHGWIDAGWIVESVDSDKLRVRKGDVMLWVDESEMVTAHNAPLDRSVSVRFPRESFASDPGFYAVYGDCFALLRPPLVRLYWNVDPRGAPALTAALTRALNQARIPFRFKILKYQAEYPRCDAAVLYLAATSYASAVKCVGTIHGSVRGWLGSDTPALTRQLAPGLGLAADPGESFGVNRSRLIAWALVDAFQKGECDHNGRVEMVRRAFEGAGIDPETPHLSRDSPPLAALLP